MVSFSSVVGGTASGGPHGFSSQGVRDYFSAAPSSSCRVGNGRDGVMDSRLDGQEMKLNVII